MTETPQPEILKPPVSTALVVDPVETTGAILEKQLSQLGIQCTLAKTAQEAVEAVGRKPFDLVMADDMLPDNDGFELAQTIKAAKPETQFIVLTQNVKLSDSDPARAIVKAVLPKPLSRQVLYRVLMELDPRPAEPAPPTSEAVVQDTPTDESPMMFQARKRSSEPVAFASKRPVPVPADPGSTSAPPSEAVTEPQAPSARLVRVLAAEDNKTNQLVFRKMLKSANIDLVFANNGIEAVEAFSTFVPDIIFMDISMPKMDGKEATSEIRKLEAQTGQPRTPIVAMTAHAMQGDEEVILAAGLDKYLTKPLKKAAVLHEIAELTLTDVAPVFEDQLAG